MTGLRDTDGPRLHPRGRHEPPAIAPYDAFPVGDGSCIVSSVRNGRGWARLCRGFLPVRNRLRSNHFDGEAGRLSPAAARNRWAQVDSPVGAVLTLLPPVPSSGWEVALGPIPALGRDNTRILAELGFDDGFDGCTPNRIPRRGTMIQEDNR